MKLWGSYRGRASYLNLLESINMGLEKFLLELAEKIESKNLEQLLFYLLKKSKFSGIMYHNHQKCLKLRIEGAFEAT